MQAGGAETRTCSMIQGCCKLCPWDCPSKHVGRTFLGQEVLFAPLHCLPLRLSPWKQNKMFLINSRALTLLPLNGAVIKLPRIAIPWWSHVTSACKSACRKELLCLPAMENRRALCLPACQIICVSLFITHLPPFQVFLTCCAGCIRQEPEIKLPNPLDYRKSKRIPEERLLLHWLH